MQASSVSETMGKWALKTCVFWIIPSIAAGNYKSPKSCDSCRGEVRDKNTFPKYALSQSCDKVKMLPSCIWFSSIFPWNWMTKSTFPCLPSIPSFLRSHPSFELIFSCLVPSRFPAALITFCAALLPSQASFNSISWHSALHTTGEFISPPGNCQHFLIRHCLGSNNKYIMVLKCVLKKVLGVWYHLECVPLYK